MSTVDQKEPPPAAGGEALLQAIVKDHLQRAAQPRPDPVPFSPPEPPKPDPATLPARDPHLSEEQRVVLLQREIDTLLKDTTDHGPARPTRHAITTSPKVSAEEVSLLLADDAPDASGEPVAASPPSAAAAVPLDEDTAAKLVEAEGVLQEELAQLMAQPKPSESPLQPAADTAKPRPTSPGSQSPGLRAPDSPAPQSPPAISAPVAAAPPSVPAMPEPALIPTPDLALTAGPLHRCWQFVGDLLLMIAQLLDVPFAWIQDMDKNIIGFAAFLILLSGVMLYVISLFTGH